jgi:serine/threonine protein kinase
MSYCLNPSCLHPQNSPQSNFCRSCGVRLRLRDRYLAIEPIGQGGFGRTFKAIDEDKPSKPFCVIKQFFPQIEGTTAAQKAAELFTQEASALEQLDDRHIPKLLAYFITPDGRQYLVQEFIDGQNLKAELEKNGLFSPAQVRELLMSMLSILEYVHRLGFIHRDIKPENIIRRTDNQQLYLVDFGAAKIATTAAQSQLAGTKIGTPEFMAPEQGWGRAFPSSDLYSLGVTCLHLLTGISPFDLFDDNRGEWIWRNTLNGTIELQLAEVLDKLIQLKPIDRYPAAQAALSDLQSNIVTQNLAAQTNSNQPISIEVKNSQSITTSTSIKSELPAVVNRNSQKWKCTDTLKWHNKPINTIAIFTNGKYLISGDEGGTVAVWNLTSQQPMATYRTNNSILTVAASSNHSQIASGDKDRKVQLRRKESIGNSVQELHGDFSNLDSHNGFVYTVQFSSDGKILASGGADRKIKLWNTDTGKIIYTLDGHQDVVTAIQFMPNGKILIGAGADRTIRFWDLEHKQLIKTIEAHEQKIHALAISQDGKIIISGSSDRTIQIRQLGTTTHHILPGHQDAVLTVAISPDRKTIASGSIDGMVNLWNADTHQLTASFQAHQSAVKSIVFKPVGNTFISASWDRTIKVWQLSQ